MGLYCERIKNMKFKFLLGLSSAALAAPDNPSHHFCALYGYEPVPYEKIVPDLNLDDAWPSVKNEGYVEKGRVINIQGLDMYVVGNGTTALIWNYDIYGFNSGRTREYCDLFADNGFLVLLPDYFRGEVFPEELNDQGEFTCRMTDWGRLSVIWTRLSFRLRGSREQTSMALLVLAGAVM